MCPHCGSAIVKHCDSRLCDWYTCVNPYCQTYGIPGLRWSNPTRPLPPQKPPEDKGLYG